MEAVLVPFDGPNDFVATCIVEQIADKVVVDTNDDDSVIMHGTAWYSGNTGKKKDKKYYVQAA
jgi:hypothetical protein